MSECNHIWRDTTFPHPKTSTEELLRSVKKSGRAGWWLKEGEKSYVNALIATGCVKYCDHCSRKAVVYNK